MSATCDWQPGISVERYDLSYQQREPRGLLIVELN